ncbi:MAG: hypothetical protein HC810_04410 [Acaryochloridaceae cyanobacterium RL_2_7]|nr:hypothetical protein [Acaryochloridaceae cyanobacterium RL_2_7]
MVFNWFKRKYANDDTDKPEEEAAVEITETDEDSLASDSEDEDDDEDSSAEDYLAWAQAAFDKLQDSEDTDEEGDASLATPSTIATETPTPLERP